MRSGVVIAFAILASCRGVVVTAFPDQFVGVGLELTVRDDIATVVRPIEGGPAAQAGLQTNDRILEINGESIRGLALPDVVLRLRGENGSIVNVKFLRGDEQVMASLVRRDISRRGEDYVARTH